jgi:hypothetical protein
MKAALNLLLLSLAVFTSSIVRAEELKFQYTLGSAANICFLQNIAENIQGKLISEIFSSSLNIYVILNPTCFVYSYR